MVKGERDAPVLVIMPSPLSQGHEVYFYEKMRECGFKQTDIRLIYILEEEPANSGNRPSAAQLKIALPRVRQEIEESSPKVIMPLGKDALYMATGLKVAIDDARGYLIKPDLRGSFVYDVREIVGYYKKASVKTGAKAGDPKYGNRKRAISGFVSDNFKGYVIPSYPIDSVVASGFTIGPALKADIKRAKRAIDGKLEIIDEGFSYTDNLDNVHCLSGSGRSVFSGNILALDIETAGRANQVIERVGISDGHQTYSLPWDTRTKEFVQRSIDEDLDYILFHNLPFDYPRLRNEGIDFSRCRAKLFDTMYAAATVQPDLRKGLGCVASFYLDTYPWKWEQFVTADPNRYNALDTYKTVQILTKGIKPMAEQLRMWPLLTGEGFPYGPGIMATIPTLSDMTERGLRINKPFAIQWDKELTEKLRDLMHQWTATLPECDAGSNKQVANWLYKEWKLPVVKNKKGNVTTDEFAVVKTSAYIQSDWAKHKDNGPWKSDSRCTPELFKLLLDIRETSKQLGTYCAPILLAEEDYVHPSYLPRNKFGGKDQDDDQSKGGAATGRLASSGPNIQNQGWIARNLFVPDDDSLCFLQHDYNKAELYAMGAMSGDLVMLSDLTTDPYQRVADTCKTDRKTAKNVVLASQYLAGAQKVSDMILKQQHFYISPTECKRIIDGISKRWTKRTSYIRSLCLTVQNKFRSPYLINPFGRVRIFHDRRAAAAVDFIPQSIVADILWCVLKDIAEYAQSVGGRLTTTVHDSVLTQVPENKVEEAAQKIKEIMERTFDCVRPGFFIPVSYDIGKPGAAWGTLK